MATWKQGHAKPYSINSTYSNICRQWFNYIITALTVVTWQQRQNATARSSINWRWWKRLFVKANHLISSTAIGQDLQDMPYHIMTQYRWWRPAYIRLNLVTNVYFWQKVKNIKYWSAPMLWSFQFTSLYKPTYHSYYDKLC